MSEQGVNHRFVINPDHGGLVRLCFGMLVRLFFRWQSLLLENLALRQQLVMLPIMSSFRRVVITGIRMFDLHRRGATSAESVLHSTPASTKRACWQDLMCSPPRTPLAALMRVLSFLAFVRLGGHDRIQSTSFTFCDSRD